MIVQMREHLPNEVVKAEEARRFSGNPVVFENACCLCCYIGIGGD